MRFDDLYSDYGDLETRWFTAENPKGEPGRGGMANNGRKGRAWVALPPGGSVVLCENHGQSGTVRRIWATCYKRDPAFMRGMRLDFYWEHLEKPAFSVPFGDFFGHGLGRMEVLESALFSSSEGRNVCSFIPMPFRESMKIVCTNETNIHQDSFYWEVDVTLGDQHDERTPWFFARYNRNRYCALLEDYELLPQVHGRGRFLGVNFGTITNKKDYLDTWANEGEVKFFLDGDKEYPTLCGTGQEDYIGTAWGMGSFNSLYHGVPIADGKNGQFTMYRHHIPDPIFFHQEIRAVAQQIGFGNKDHKRRMIEHGTKVYAKGADEPMTLDNLEMGGFERSGDDVSSCAYFYLDRSDADLPPLDSCEQRMVGLLDEERRERFDV